MATRLTFRVSNTVRRAIPQNGYDDMLRAGSTGTLSLLSLVSAPDANGERRFGFTTGSIPMGLWSERLAAEYAISGNISFSIRASIPTGSNTNKRLRARVYKITFGGSDVETLVAEGTSTANIGTTRTAQTFSITPPAAITMAPNERLILRLWLTNTDGSETAYVGYGDVSEIGWLELTENVTLKDNGTKLFLRDTVANGIGNFFDMLETRGAANVYGHVDTVASGTEEQWRRSGTLPADITVTELTAATIASTANATTYVSASFTPVADRLYLLAVVTSDAAPETTVPTVASTTGLAFVQVNTTIFDTIASNVHCLTVFRARKPSGLSAGTYTVTLADAGTGCCAQLFELNNIWVEDTAGDGSGAIRSSLSNGADASANPSISLAPMGNAAIVPTDGVLAAFGLDIATDPTVGSGWTGFTHVTSTTPTKGLKCEFRLGTPAVADLTVAASDWCAIVVRITHQAPPPSATVLEWVSPRMSNGFQITAVVDVSVQAHALESNLAANASAKVKIFKRTPSGTETLVATYTRPSELVETYTNIFAGGSWVLDAATAFQEDDRVVCRIYLVNVGTMAAGHYGRLAWNGAAAVAVGDSWVNLWPEPNLKAESDPPASPAPSGLAMSGAGT